MIRAVLDTNVIIGRFLSPNPSSPNAEIIDRLTAREFVALYSEDVIAEYIAVLERKGVPDEEIDDFLGLFVNLSESVFILSFHLQNYPQDPDDIIFLLCALNGDADFLVSNDSDLLEMRPHYDQVTICEPVPFLEALRSTF